MRGALPAIRTCWHRNGRSGKPAGLDVFLGDVKWIGPSTVLVVGESGTVLT
jgi:hypothetical protein